MNHVRGVAGHRIAALLVAAGVKPYKMLQRCRCSKKLSLEVGLLQYQCLRPCVRMDANSNNSSGCLLGCVPEPVTLGRLQHMYLGKVVVLPRPPTVPGYAGAASGCYGAAKDSEYCSSTNRDGAMHKAGNTQCVAALKAARMGGEGGMQAPRVQPNASPLESVGVPGCAPVAATEMFFDAGRLHFALSAHMHGMLSRLQAACWQCSVRGPLR